MKLTRRPRKSEEINVVPLIDVLFVLLIFFSVTTTFAKDLQLELQRPGASMGAPASPKAVRVYIDRGGNMFVEEQPVKAWMIQSRVRDLLAASTAKKVLLVVDRLVPSERLVEAVDQCKLGGAAEVAVATEAPRT